MSTLIGLVLFSSVVAGGVYLYYKVERLDREIAKQRVQARTEREDDSN